ncbi:MAG: helix-turn-helix domain-containing protein [Limosilactobacillus sp.]
MDINLSDRDIMDAKEASKLWGHAENYVRLFVKQNPEKFPKGSIRKFGATWVVTTKGMETITGVKDPRKTRKN